MPSLSFLLNSIKRTLQDVSYEYFGNSHEHLRLEVQLLLSLILITTANMMGLYNESFGTGDFIYIIFATIWLSRFLIFRMLCCFDKSTHAQPSFRGLLSLVCTAYFSGGGQVFDYPVVSAEDTIKGINASSILPVGVHYLLQWLRVRILLLYQSLRGAKQTSKDHQRKRGKGYWHGIGSNLLLNARIACHKRLPSLQALIPIVTCGALLWTVHTFFGENTGVLKLYPVTMVQSKQSIKDDTTPYGAYTPKVRPQWSSIATTMVFVGTILSLGAFFRVIQPLPDMVAGGNVIADVKHESRSRKRKEREDTSTTLTEKYFSITTENRIVLHLYIIATRLLENIALCWWLPRSIYVCRAASHCPEDFNVWELSQILYPIGVVSPLRKDATASSDVPSNWGSFVLMFVAVLITTLTVLTAQSILLSRTHLSTLGSILSAWIPVNAGDDKNVDASMWDARRKYKVGDVVLYDGVAYMAGSDTPEGKPHDRWIMHLYTILRDEVGHPSTSRVLYLASVIQFGLSTGLAFMFVVFALIGLPCLDIMFGVLGCIIAAYGCSISGGSDHGALLTLGQEIMGVPISK